MPIEHTAHAPSRSASALVLLATLIAGCGDRTPAAAPTPALSAAPVARAPAAAQPPPAPSSADCTNEADYQPGRVRRVTSRISEGDPPGTAAKTLTRTERVEGPRDFAGHRPLAVRLSGDGMIESFLYTARVDGSVVQYGTSSPGNTTTFEPPIREQTALQAGQTVKGSFRTVSAGAVIGRVDHETTYVGRAPIDTALGRFEACHFRGTSRHFAKGSDQPVAVLSDERWVAAEGLYRSATLLRKSPATERSPAQRVETVAIDYR